MTSNIVTDGGIVLRMNGGTAAGGPWLHFVIVKITDPECQVDVGKQIDVEDGYYDGDAEADGGFWVEYRAERTWDDGFVANAGFGEKVPYYSDGREPGGTPMGGSVIPGMDGLRFWVPLAVYEEATRDESPSVKAIHDLAASLIELVLAVLPDIPEGGFAIDTIDRESAGVVKVHFSGRDEAAEPPKGYAGTIKFDPQAHSWSGGWQYDVE